MKLKMAERSLFAILLRSPWWISFAIAIVLGLIASVLLPRQYAALGPSAGFPFFVIGVIAAWKQWQAPSATRIARARQVFSDMAWRDFSGVLEQAYMRKGFTVTHYAGKGADLEILGPNGKSLVSGKRWKAASTGVEPLKELAAAADTASARAIYITLGELTDNARSFANKKNIAVLRDSDLAEFLPK
ncbi:restriction endonuclease [Noviherbaspirillum saxi]|uniref:Restriction endonuclease n=1 Tax=Noviherbaspirillum saxi TaxID=2320863 RepID=A0A3A3FKT4_9BURK|nr:restriction endonuclease [Noviherbaspirillum saxi]RJF96138.1 restriction endonuclease [Noviherbaspirillum saxi]